MTPQVFENMPFSDYCQLEGINASALKGIGGCSPRHLKAYLDGDLPNDDTPDKRLGRAIHCMILEPERFNESFPEVKQCWAVIEGDKKKGTDDHRCKNTGTRRHNDLFYCGVHGKQFEELDDYVTADEKKRLNALEFALKSDPCSEYLRIKGQSEIVIQWEEFGHLLKTRIDRLAFPDARKAVTFDIKKMRVGAGRDADVRDECARRAYHIQGWFHRKAIEAAYPGIAIEQYFLFVEDDYPFCTNMLPMRANDMTIAGYEIEQSLNAFARCKSSGHFHGYQMIVNDEKGGILPRWKIRQYEEFLELESDDEESEITFGGQAL